MDTFTTFLEDIFGEYQPILIENNGEVIDSAINWGYIASVVVFCICLGFLLKTIGGVIYEWLRR